MLKAILFDLDGTLLQMNQDEFVKLYFTSLVKFLAGHGYEPKKLTEAMWTSIGAMIKNTGKRTNEEVFWSVFSHEYGKDMSADEPLFERFYLEEFDNVSTVAEQFDIIPSLIKKLKGDGYKLILATNPVFPLIATKKRAAWAGIDISDFDLVTSYENSSYSKPNLDYYRSILTTMGLSADECLMVGNDVSEDMIAESLGIRVYLITRHLLNKNNIDITHYPQGDFHDLQRYISELNDDK